MFWGMGIFVFGIIEFHYVKTAAIHVKMNISLFKIRGNGFPNPCFRIQLFKLFPNKLSYTSSLYPMFNIDKIKMIALSLFINHNDCTADHFTVRNNFVGSRTCF